MSVLTLAILNLARKKTIESFKTFLEGNHDKILRDNLYTMIYMIILILITKFLFLEIKHFIKWLN